MDRISETIEALADSLVASRPDRNSIVASLHGLARISICEYRNKHIEVNVQTNQMLDDIMQRMRHEQDPIQR